MTSENMEGLVAATPVGQETLESAVLAELLTQARGHSFGAALDRQLDSIKLIRRQLSGAGFFLEMDTPADCPPIAGVTSPLPLDLYAVFPGTDCLAGFILFLTRERKIDYLEGFTYQGDWPGDVSNFILSESLPELSPL